MNREVLLALGGGTLLTALAVGAIVLTAAAPAASIAQNSLPLAGFELAPLSGNVDLGATAEDVVAIEQTGVVNLTFTLKWTASAGADTLRLGVASSNATGVEIGEVSEAESDGEITITLAIPNTDANGRLGVGDWRVSVEFVEASSGLPGGLAPPNTTDSSVAWTLETTLQALPAA